jgi:hypothetical protein
MQMTLLHTNDLHGQVAEPACLTAQARKLRAQIEASSSNRKPSEESFLSSTSLRRNFNGSIPR